MNALDILGIFFFLANVGIFMGKVYNLMSKGTFYDKRISIIGFVASLMSWLVIYIFFSSLLGADTLMIKSYSFLLTLTSFLVILNFFLMAMELILQLSLETVSRNDRFGKPRNL